MKIEKINIDLITPYENNAKIHTREQIEQIKKSIEMFGNNDPIAVDENDVIIEGHGRLYALQELGYKEVEIIRLSHLTDEQKRAYMLVHNKLTMNTGFDINFLEAELKSIEQIDMGQFEFECDFGNITGLEFDDFTEDELQPPPEPKTRKGDVYRLGSHRLMCGDSTDGVDVDKLMGGEIADLVFTDPPYGMKKEAEGVLNDNLNYDDLLEFNKQWIPLTFDALKDNGSWYCWGIDEPLMDIYSEILKPMIKQNKITFRNLITWDKGSGQGQLSEDFRMYPIADEKCLFIQVGIQALTLNADQYWEEYEPIRKYLYDSRVAMGWDVPTMKKIVGHSDIFRDHWTSKSQFSMPTRDVYEKMKVAAEKQRQEKGIDNGAFRREYDDLRREYDDLRAYFDNTHDNMNNVWHFNRTSAEERETTGGHATPKPIALCSRAIKSSSREGEIVLDVFGGSGSTLIACEQTGRKCYAMELDPGYCDVIVERWEKTTGKTAELIGGER